MKLIKSLEYDEQTILSSIIKLHCNGTLYADVTYSKGNFYKKDICTPAFISDLHPSNDSVIKADCRNLPLPENSLSSVMFDPPFLASKGPSLSSNTNSNKIVKRFGCYATEKELHTFYIDSLRELYRVLRLNGILIFKCQDKVSGGKQYFSHCFIHDQAIKQGFYPLDLFILGASSRLTPDW